MSDNLGSEVPPRLHAPRPGARPTLIFYHVPKTAGTTFSAIGRHLARRGVFRFYRRFGRPGVIPPRPNLFIEQDLHPAFVTGHWAYSDAPINVPHIDVALLRRPIDQFLSNCVHQGLVDPVGDAAGNRRAVERAMRERLVVENLQSRILCGEPTVKFLADPADPAPALVVPDLAAVAGRFAVIATTEQFDAALAALSAIYRIGRIDYERSNVREPDYEAFAPLFDDIVAYNGIDQALHDLVSARPPVGDAVDAAAAGPSIRVPAASTTEIQLTYRHRADARAG